MNITAFLIMVSVLTMVLESIEPRPRDVSKAPLTTFVDTLLNMAAFCSSVGSLFSRMLSRWFSRYSSYLNSSSRSRKTSSCPAAASFVSCSCVTLPPSFDQST